MHRLQILHGLGFSIANYINTEAVSVNDITDEDKETVKNISEVLLKAENPVIISGTSSKSEEVMQAAANIAWALCIERTEKGNFLLLSKNRTVWEYQ